MEPITIKDQSSGTKSDTDAIWLLFDNFQKSGNIAVNSMRIISGLDDGYQEPMS